ncbi:putative ubiquitin carboxyl-terminal hydrolase 17-like protein 23 [Pongo pygmaeus]|uniref:putative ubiquitin carboxyl-terminal hydrolase 17-like protein 23 n=1 Tax=Pongo pygmaeus TaxID=9600 RepID=UPI00300C8255
MEDDSLCLGGEWQLNRFSKLTCSGPGAAFAEIQRTSLPEKSPLSSETRVDLCDDLAPVARQLAPREQLPLSSRRPAAVGAGLQNMGNTCYVNASLQCLTYTPPLANYMLSREHSQTCHGHKGCMLCTMQAHITRALHRPGHVIQPSRALAAGFHRGKQEDAHEFLMFTVDAMKKACLPGHKLVDHHSKDTTLMHQIFGGYVPELDEHLVETATQESTLDYWKFLQEQNKTKPDFNVRKVEGALGLVHLVEPTERRKQTDRLACFTVSNSNELKRKIFPLAYGIWGDSGSFVQLRKVHL